MLPMPVMASPIVKRRPAVVSGLISP